MLGVADRVGHGALEVGVGVEADEVARIDDGLVGAVHPCGPGINVADGNGPQRGARDGAADLVDIRGDRLRASSNTGMVLVANHGVAVEILAADTDTNNATGECVAKLVDGRLDRGDLAVNGRGSGRTPDTQKERGVLGDGGRDGSDRAVGSAALLRVMSLVTSPIAAQREREAHLLSRCTAEHW